MKLNNPFGEDVKLFYLYSFECRLCGSNQRLEIHHITGRTSSSIFNSCLLCQECHSRMCHSQEEEQKLFALTFKECYNKQYKPVRRDYEFLADNHRRLFTGKLIQWLNSR